MVCPKLVSAYERLSDKELAEYYELRDLLEPEQVVAIMFVMALRRAERGRR